MARLLAGKIRTTRGNWTLIPLFVIFLENSCVADEPHGLARRRSAPVLPGDRGSWGAPLIRIQEQTKMQLDWVSPKLASARAPDLAVMTHSNRAAVFHLSLLIAER